MFNTTHIKLIAAVAAAAALTPALADAKLGGHPTLTTIDATHASLRFAADERPSKITFAGGQAVGTIKAVGKHGNDTVYRAKVTSETALRAGTKYTVTFRTPGEKPAKRLVKLR